MRPDAIGDLEFQYLLSNERGFNVEFTQLDVE